MKVCPKCNKANPSTFTRCPCGEDLKLIKNVDKAEIPLKKIETNKKKKIPLFNIVVAFFVVLAIVFVIMIIDGVSETMNNSNNHGDRNCDICGKSAYGYLYGNEYCYKHYNDMKN